MRKVILYIAMSLDGCIADKNGGVSWLGGDGSDPENPGSYPSFIDQVDTVILGYTTYRQIVTELSPDQWMYAGKQTYVITHNQLESKEEITFTGENPAILTRRLKNMPGRDIWICGGAAIARQVMDAGLIDEFCISMIPTVLGGGIRLFGTGDIPRQLTLISTLRYNGIVDLVYKNRPAE